MEGEGDGLRLKRWRVRDHWWRVKVRSSMDGEGDGLRLERWRVTVEIGDEG